MANPESVLNVNVLSPQNLSWNGKARAVIGENSIGLFSILPEHANFITVISGTIKIIQTSGADYSFEVGFGLLYCRENDVKVFIQLPLEAASRKQWWQQFVLPNQEQKGK